MPVLVNCPSCSGPLRVADDLIGRKVRCPACQTVFDAKAPADGGNDLPLETQPIDSWKNLDLEMTRDHEPAPPPKPKPQEPARGLVGALEIDAGPQEPPRRPPPRDEEERTPSYRREEDDMRACPGCGKMLHADSTRCFACGERLGGGRDVRSVRYRDDDDYLPTRRDCEPHRGTPVLVLGILSLVSLMMSFCPVVFNVVGAILGAIGWWMGSSDLSKMRVGTMDPDGKGTTQAGWICAMLGTLLNTMTALLCGGWIGFAFYADYQAMKQQQQPGFKPPAPMQAPMDPVPPKKEMLPPQKDVIPLQKDKDAN